MEFVLRIIFAGLIGLVAIAIALFPNSLLSLACTSLSNSVHDSLEYHFLRPHAASWRSWHHPHHLSYDNDDEGFGTQGSEQRGGTINSEWNVLHHLGGNGPWVEKTEGVVDGGIGPPQGCYVEQVHLMSRHAERYPTARAGHKMLQLKHHLDNLTSLNITLQGDLSFANNWTFITNDSSNFEHLTHTGPFAGTLGAFTTGVKLLTRYSHLVPTDNRTTHFFACGCKRVIDTARYFGLGFFGHSHESRKAARLHIIPEDATYGRGANTLTPGKSCRAYLEDPDRGRARAEKELAAFRRTYIPAIRARLFEQNPGVEFTDDEIWSMQELCGFETTVRGRSRWCDVFTRSEWLSFEYARDLVHYYRTGPGTPYGALLGSLWLNATANLLARGPNDGTLFFSFVHDGDVIPLMAALGLFGEPGEELPNDQVVTARKWRTSQIVPMGGRVIFERLKCDHAALDGRRSGDERGEAFVRINVNDGIVAIPGCDGGPGRSCPLDGFLDMVRTKTLKVGDYRERCGLGMDAPGSIEFLHQDHSYETP